MTRSLLQPIRTRRVARLASAPVKSPSLTPRTRQTLSAIGALWVSFAVTSDLATSPTSLAK